MTDSPTGLSTSPDAGLHAQFAGAGNDALTGSQSDSNVASAFQDQFHDYMQARYAPDTGRSGMQGGESADTVLVASGQQGGGSAIGSIMNYAGYITYAGLAASAFGHDDPFQLQTRATRFFQEKILHHHAIDNPHTWAAMGDALMVEQHLASQGAHFKPLKLRGLKGEIKREEKGGQEPVVSSDHDAKEANGIIKEISAGLKSPDDYVLAAKYLYAEAVRKADARSDKEAKDHKDEKRLLGRLNLLSGETDRGDAIGSRDNSVNPMLDDLGVRVSYRLDEAAFLERYGSKVPELGWNKEAADLRTRAREIYNNPNALSEPVRRRLHERYSDILTDSDNKDGAKSV